jgi:hypothetical protein
VENIGDEKVRREIRNLADQIKSDSGCVLILGPRIAVRAGDPDRRPLEDVLTEELTASLDEAPLEAPASLRQAADLHFRRKQDRRDLQTSVRDFYAREAPSMTEFHRCLARLPFKLCISASPDSMMLNAFESVGKHPQKDYYHFQPQGRHRRADLAIPTEMRPLVYYLFGHHEDDASLVLTEADLIDYLVKIIKGDPPVPDKVRSFLADPSASFLFLGFGFQNWYLRVLLKVLDVYGHRFKSVAFEDPQFVDAPESRHAIAFYKDHRIEFRRLSWEPFAERLLQTYLECLPPRQSGKTSAPALVGADAPEAFLSYASEDVEAVAELAENLQANGIRVWRDKTNLRAGDRWNEVLLSVIKERVDYVIVVQTIAMTMRISGVFFREIVAAQEKHEDMGEFDGQRLRFLIPVTLGCCQPLSSLKGLHTIDVDVGAPGGLDALVAAVQEDWKIRLKLRSLQARAA